MWDWIVLIPDHCLSVYFAEPCQLAYDDSHMKYKRGAELVTTGSEVKDGQTVLIHTEPKLSCRMNYRLALKSDIAKFGSS